MVSLTFPIFIFQRGISVRSDSCISFAGTLGPELQVLPSSTRNLRIGCRMLQNHSDPVVKSEALGALQQLQLFAPKDINIAPILSFLCVGLYRNNISFDGHWHSRLPRSLPYIYRAPNPIRGMNAERSYQSCPVLSSFVRCENLISVGFQGSLESEHVTLRHAAIACLRQFLQRDPMEIFHHIAENPPVQDANVIGQVRTKLFDLFDYSTLE